VPIFHGGALVANVRLSRAQAAEAALNYRKTVLNALQEVEDGLNDLREDALRTSALEESVAAGGKISVSGRPRALGSPESRLRQLSRPPALHCLYFVDNFTRS
jgi:hypothetical protein